MSMVNDTRPVVGRIVHVRTCHDKKRVRQKRKEQKRTKKKKKEKKKTKKKTKKKK